MPWGNRAAGMSQKYAIYLARVAAERWENRVENKAQALHSLISEFGSKQVICGSCGKPHVTHKRARSRARCGDCWPLAERARSAAMLCVSKAIASGELQRPGELPCADCERPAAEYDHRDYSKPLQVDPTCRRCNLRRGPAAPFNSFLA